MQFLTDRFTESHCQNISTDEVGNCAAIVPGTEGKRNILVLAHADTPFDASVDHTVAVQPSGLQGPGIGAADQQVAELGEQLGAVRGLGHGNLEGLRFFLENNKTPLRAGICLEGCYIGRLSYQSIGMYRGVVEARVPNAYDWTRFNAAGAIPVMTRVVNRILAIPLPRQPRTSVVLGSISGGQSFDTIATSAKLRFEIRSEEAGMVSSTLAQIEDIVEEAAIETEVKVSLRQIARRKPGGIPYTHPLVKSAREVLSAMDIEPRVAPSVGELSALIDKGIPGLTVGLTSGENLHEPEERVDLEPMFSGIANLVALLRAVDSGLCDTQQEADKPRSKKSVNTSSR